ncbi:transcriptional repressor [Cryobacterium sp. TMT1-3]|uniref:Transcriptional repressor n=1 Tax=Cryobacterium luteum TaxID=1424661 RepID=A0A5F0D312_9MICO|nr:MULTISPECIES: Fur family transcriptional regulator [Cryobacterium]TFB85222.1 transcriptional repressor [Cryobacterium luteum]TFC29134.1 transcriptional repressor [Cryobacterium sp. TMT1-3]
MITSTPKMLSDSIRGAGLKVTESRLAVLKALESQSHADANTVFDSVKLDLPGTSLQAVYGVLTALTSAGLLRKIAPARSSARYELRTGDNHHHVVCTRCSAVQDVDCVVGEAPCLTPLHDSGFAIHTAEVTFWGLCPACQLTNS